MQDFQKQCYEKLELNIIIKKLADIAILPAVKKQILELKPINDLNILNVELTNVEECTGIVRRLERAPFYLASEYDNTLKLLKKGGSLSGLEIYDTVKLYQTISANCNLVNDLNKFQIEANYYRELVNELYINQYINKELIKSIDENGNVLDDASVELKSIRKKLVNIEANVKQKLQEIISKEGSKLSQTSVVLRDDRFCLAVKSEYKNVVKGVIHDTSASMQTCFIEPLAVSQLMNDKVRLLEQEKEEINRILKRLSELLQGEVEVLINNFDILKKIDLMFAKAVLAISYDGNKPNLNLNCKLDLKNARHPLLKVKKVIPNNVTFGNDYLGIVVTGPNTGGKTVSLKTVGLLTLMAQSGLFIPALDHSDIAVFKNIYADIGDEQSIEQSLSTFSSHMTNTVKILKEADENCLVLFDEIGAGTDPTEGAALAIAILNDLKMRGVTTMATTHYSEIKLYALSTEGVENASCEFDVESLRPTYRLLIGIPGKSNAFAISKKLGLPDYILSDASERLNAEDVHFEDIVSDLEHARISLEKEQAEVESYKAEIASLKEKLQAKNERLDERTDNIIRKANEQAAAILKEAKDFADETIKAMNKHGMTVAELEKHRTAVREKMNKNQAKLKVEPAKVKAHKAHDISEFKTGMHVKVLTMNVSGTVSAIHPAKKQVTVQVGALSTKIDIKNLEILSDYKEPKEAPSKAAGGSGKIKMSKSAGISTEINLLGCTVDEAVARLDKYLDDAYIARIPQVRIVHGKGTGALRNGVTAYLRGVPYIKSFRLGEIGEGDAGVTIVDFK